MKRLGYEWAVGRVPVTSSSLASVGYAATRCELEVEFRHGPVYLYSGVPKHVFEGLMAADSKGRFFNARIRDAYACIRQG